MTTVHLSQLQHSAVDLKNEVDCLRQEKKELQKALNKAEAMNEDKQTLARGRGSSDPQSGQTDMQVATVTCEPGGRG